ncbi:MAG: hypothetical protein J6X58_04230 [Bacteroidales bacterium]|nr:hypothetical protein [Bacteroidales bacterium]
MFSNKRILTLILLLVAYSTMPVQAQKAPPPSGSRNDFKITLLSLGSGSSRFTYERAFSQRHSGEATLGIIGLGWDWMNKSRPQGLLVKLAYKWRLVPQKSSDSWLGGLYAKPELVLASFKYGHKPAPGEEPPKCPKSTDQIALLAEIGYQLVIDWFVFDIYSGLGPSIGSGNDNNYYHSFMLFPKEGWLAFTAGFRIGVAF